MNCLLTNYTTTINGQEMYLCLNCIVEFQVSTYAKYVVFQSPIYMNARLSKHPSSIQSLSFLNIGLHIQNWNWGFSLGEIMNISLLNSPLLSWDRILDSKKM
jgi:hypothetical protein